MLELIRERAQGIVVWVIVGLIIITFALFGLSSYLSGTATVNVATINDVDISQTQFLRAYQNYQERLKEMLGKNYNPEIFNEDTIKKQVLDGLVTREVLTQALGSSGFSASSQQIFSQIKSIDSFNDETGQFSNKNYKRALALQGFNSVLFEQSIARDIEEKQLEAGLMNSVFVTPTQKADYVKLYGQQRDIDYLQISQKTFSNSIDVTDDEIKKYYSENSAAFTTEEMISVEYIELNINDAAEKIEIDDAAMQEDYKQNIKIYESTPEQRKASHILITIDSNTTDASAKKTASEVLVKIKKGESFLTLAKEYSKDPGSASKGGDLGYFGKGVMDKAFEDTVFDMSVGDVSEVVKTNFGYHIIKLSDIKAGKVAPYKDVKDKIKKSLQLQQAEQQFYTDIDKLNNLTYETPDTLEPAAEALGLEIKKSKLYTRRSAAGVLANIKAISAAFGKEVLSQGRNSEMLELSDTHLLVLRNKEHQPAAPLVLEKVKSRITILLQRDKAINQAQNLAKELLGKLEAGEKAETLVKANKAIQLNKAGLISRTAVKGGPNVSGAIRQFAFGMAKPLEKVSYKQVSLNNGDQAIILLNKVVDGESLAEAEQQKLLSMYGSTGYDGYLNYLKSEADIVLHDKNIKSQ